MLILDANRTPTKAINKHMVYNGLDCLVTTEVHQVLKMLLRETNREDSYQRSIGELAIALRMGIRGFAVDTELKESTRASHEKRIAHLKELLDIFAVARWGKPLNPDSPKQMKQFWFGKTPVYRSKRLEDYVEPNLGMKPIYTFSKGERKLSCNRPTLEKLAQKSNEAALFSNLILLIRDLSKENEVFSAPLSNRKRARCGLNVGGTDTYRWSSNETPLWDGRNMQNISASLRDQFVADKGHKLAYVDLEQAESRIVAYVTGDKEYIAACEGGDLHSTVCEMVWPELGWASANGNPSAIKAIAEQMFYRSFTYRDMAKRGGHGTNYFGKPPTMARHLNIETRVMAAFQENYFESFPGITEWHERVERTLLDGNPIVTALGRVRQFFGRANDAATLRAAIAYEPQSTLSSIMKQSHMNMVRAEDSNWAKRCEFKVLHDLHDAVVFSYKEEAEAETMANAIPLMKVPIDYPSGTLIIPVEAAVGWSWGYPIHADKKDKRSPVVGNFDGLVKLKTGQTDQRERTSFAIGSLPLRSNS